MFHLSANKCVNTLTLHMNSVTSSPCNYCVFPITGDELVNQAKNALTNDHVSLAAEVTNSQDLSAVRSNELINTSRLTENYAGLAEPRFYFLIILVLVSKRVILPMVRVYLLEVQNVSILHWMN